MGLILVSYARLRWPIQNVRHFFLSRNSTKKKELMIIGSIHRNNVFHNFQNWIPRSTFSIVYKKHRGNSLTTSIYQNNLGEIIVIIIIIILIFLYFILTCITKHVFPIYEIKVLYFLPTSKMAYTLSFSQ